MFRPAAAETARASCTSAEAGAQRLLPDTRGAAPDHEASVLLMIRDVDRGGRTGGDGRTDAWSRAIVGGALYAPTALEPRGSRRSHLALYERCVTPRVLRNIGGEPGSGSFPGVDDLLFGDAVLLGQLGEHHVGRPFVGRLDM